MFLQGEYALHTGVSAPGGVPSPRGCLLWGGSAPGGGGGIPVCTEADPPCVQKFLTHATDNNTLPQTSFAYGNKIIEALLLCY